MKKSYEFYSENSLLTSHELYNMLPLEKEALDNMGDNELQELFNHLLTFRKTRAAMHHLLPFFQNDKKKLLKQLIKCNFGELDHIRDVTPERINVEAVKCPHKGKHTCPFKGEGIVCIKSEAYASKRSLKAVPNEC